MKTEPSRKAKGSGRYCYSSLPFYVEVRLLLTPLVTHVTRRKKAYPTTCTSLFLLFSAYSEVKLVGDAKTFVTLFGCN